MTNERKSERTESKRVRVPFGSHRLKLEVTDEIKGYHLRWFNDQDGRIQRAEEGGYEFVKKDEVPRLGQGALHQDNTDLNDKVSKVVSRGEPVIRAYLMKIKQEWYDEDQAAKQRKVDLTDEAMRKGHPGGNVVDNQYVPKGHKQEI
jgi:hypothetical protein